MKLVCTSHSPLLLSVSPRDKHLGDRFFAALETAQRTIMDYAPGVIIIFAPDHFNGFFYDNMPSFCIGLEATASADWDIEPGKLNVPRSLARDLAEAMRTDGLDVAISYRMTIDHGFTIPLKLLVQRLDAFPTIPIFINCNAPPLPSCRRVRLMGEAVGRFLRRNGARAVLIGSGGLSHDPPHPSFENAPPDVQQLLTAAKPWDSAHERARQDRVKTAANELIKGGGPCLPPNPTWDRAFLDLLFRQELERMDAFSDSWIRQEGGSGGQEIRNWIAGFAALGAGGRYRAAELYYEVVTEWITGMAVVQAEV